jgi:hypothetical protein
LGILESKTGGNFLLDAIGDETENYFIYMNIGGKYYSIAYSDYKGEKPPWIGLVEYIQALMEEYIIDENSIEGSEYLEILDSQLEIYGTHPLFTGDITRRYVEKEESEN